MEMALFRSGPRAAAQPIVRVTLPPSMGRTVSLRGRTFEADAEGVLSLPADLARELQDHIPTQVEAPVSALPELAARIKGLQAEIATEQKKRGELETAVGIAGERLGAADAAPSVEDVSQKQRRTVADYVLGLVKRADVDAIEAEARKAQRQRDDQARARELAALAITELHARIRVHDEKIAQLSGELSELTNRAIRVHSDERAVALRALAREYLTLFGQVQWCAQLLAKTPQAFAPWPDSTIDLPVLAQADCAPGAPLRATLNHLTMRAGGAHEFIDLAEARAAVQQQLAAAGINF
jgi:uncharacterized small protein (DUF1192 family)